RREWKVIGSAAVTSLGLVAVTAWIYGTKPWLDFLLGTSRVQASMIDAHGNFFGFMSTSAATAALSVSAHWQVALTVQIGFAAAALWMVVDAGLRNVDLRAHALLTGTAPFSILPSAL